MIRQKQTLLDSALYPDFDKKTKLPLWLHYVLRLSLIGLNIALTIYLWQIMLYIYAIIVGFLAIYQVSILFYGEKIRSYIIGEMTKYE